MDLYEKVGFFEVLQILKDRGFGLVAVAKDSLGIFMITLSDYMGSNLIIQKTETDKGLVPTINGHLANVYLNMLDYYEE